MYSEMNQDLFKIVEFFGGNVKLIKLRGYAWGNTDYKKAKTPIGKWQEAEPLSEKDIVDHVSKDGWLGLVIPDNYIVIDVDNPSAGQIIYDGLRACNINHMAIKTPYGFQFLFSDKYKVKTQGAKMVTLAGLIVDYRLAGRGYIVMPSMDTEGRVIINFSDVLDTMPDIFVPVYQAKENEDLLPIPISDGSRNDVLFKHACRLQVWSRKYQPDIDIPALLHQINQMFCQPPLEGNEVEKIHMSSSNYSYENIGARPQSHKNLSGDNSDKRIISGPEVFRIWQEDYRSCHISPPKTIATGIRIMDVRLDGGFRPEQLAIIGGLPGAGKTALTLQIGGSLAEQGHMVLIYNFEMSHDALMQRFISRSNNIIISDLSNRIIDPNIIYMPSYLKNAGFGFADSALSINQIVEDIEYMYASLAHHGEHITPVIIIDYLQRMQHLAGKRTGDVRSQMNENISILKELAVKTKGVILCVCALNREAAKSGLDMTSFRETSEIEYAADVLVGMGTAIKDKNGNYTMARKDELQESRLDTNVVVQLKFLKIRHFMEGDCLLNFHRDYQRFEAFRGEN